MRWVAEGHQPPELRGWSETLKTFSLFFLQLVIPLTTQDDLDKAVELLDRSVHMKSLKILLVLQNLSQVSRLSRRVAGEQGKLEVYN